VSGPAILLYHRLFPSYFLRGYVGAIAPTQEDISLHCRTASVKPFEYCPSSHGMLGICDWDGPGVVSSPIGIKSEVALVTCESPSG